MEKVEEIYLEENTAPYTPICKGKLNSIEILRQTYFIINDTYQEIISDGQLNLIPESTKTSLM
jgi:hypothetical protein